MACELKQTIKDKTVRGLQNPVVEGDRIVVPLSENQNLSLIESKIDSINKEYLGNIFGNPLLLSGISENTVIIDITISESLQEASDIRDGKKPYPNLNTSLEISQEVQYQIPQNIQGEYNDVVSPFEKMTRDEQVAFEKTIRDISARISDRIGIPYRIENRKDLKYKGKIENGTAVVNLAYATLDTPIHEILGHPIIRAIRDRNTLTEEYLKNAEFGFELEGLSKAEIAEEIKKLKQQSKRQSALYQNLLKELEYGKGKEVLDRIKRDYQFKDNDYYVEKDWMGNWLVLNKNNSEKNYGGLFDSEQAALNYINSNFPAEKYTLEEQQEEALVELLGLYTAGKLNNVKDGKLISLLKRLLKEVKAFMKQLLGQREVEIDKLPDNMTLGDIADLLAYSNSKLILPGYEVVYTTPDNQQFKTYQEASNHISELAKSVEDVDLTIAKIEIDHNNRTIYIDGKENKLLYEYIEKNKQYEQSKEIIEEWKKVNSIQYNPEEVYSRGQEFVSVVGAYSDFDVDLMMQNLLEHIKDNQKADGEFTISAFTKPVDRKINHLEGGGGKIKFKIYPQSQDIKWAANTDVYSGSVWDASEKVSKDKKSELLGVSYTKYPSLQNVNAVQPNLASIVDDLAHHHNELGISLTGSNFRLEYDENIPYQTKKIIDSINKILDQKYGKLVKPEVNQKEFGTKYIAKEESAYGDFKTTIFNTEKEALDYKKSMAQHEDISVRISRQVGIQPTQTKETLKESLESIRSKAGLLTTPYGIIDTNEETLIQAEDSLYSLQKAEILLNDNSVSEVLVPNNKWFIKLEGRYPSEGFDTKKQAEDYLKNEIIKAENLLKQLKSKPKKEYTEQALINIKIAKLKEVAKKYPRSLIRSEVVRVKEYYPGEFSGFAEGELPFQKVPQSNSFQQFQQSLNKPNTNPVLQGNQEEQVKKFAELQERLNNKEFLEGAKNAFESSGELQNVYYKTAGFDTPNLPIVDTENITSFEGTKGAAQYDKKNNQIKVNSKLLKQKFSEQAWTKPRKLIEVLNGEQIESYAQALPENQFTTYQEWEQFVINHEYQHSLYSRQDFDREFPNKTKGDYESEINRRALNQITPEQKQQALNAYTNYIARVSLGIIKNPSSGGYNYESKVRDIVYHTSSNKFDRFDKSFIGRGIGNTTEGVGFYFSNRKDSFNEYKKIVNLSKDVEKLSFYNSNTLNEKRDKLLKELKNNNFNIDIGTQYEYGFIDNYEYPSQIEKLLGWTEYQKIKNSVEDYYYYLDKLTSENQERFLNEDNNPYEEIEERFQQSLDLQDSAILLTTIINLKNPKVFNNRQLLKDNSALKDNDGTKTNIGIGDIQYVVFEPEQIHILSSKADIQGFKDFMSFENSEFSNGIENETTFSSRFEDTGGTGVLKHKSIVDNFKQVLDDIGFKDPGYILPNTPQNRIKQRLAVRNEIARIYPTVKEWNDAIKDIMSSYGNITDINRYFDFIQVRTGVHKKDSDSLFGQQIIKIEYGRIGEVYDKWKQKLEIDDSNAFDLKMPVLDFIEEMRRRGDDTRELEKYAEEEENREDEYNSRLNLDESENDSFEAVFNWKSKQLDIVNEQIARLNISIKNESNKEVRNEKRKDLKKLENNRDLLESQIALLYENREELSLQTVLEDLENIEAALRSEDIHDIERVRESLNFYKDFIKEIDDDSLRKTISEKVGGILNEYNINLRKKVIALLEKESLVQETLENLNEDEDAKKQLGKNSDEIITIEDLLIALSDINSIDKSAFGLISSQVGDTIIPQYLLYTFKKILNKWENNVFTEYIDQLREFNSKEGFNKIDRKDLLEKDENGVLTGNLIGHTTAKWGDTVRGRSALIKNLIRGKINSKKEHYNSLVNWHKENTEVINFFKLKSVRDKFGDSVEYRDYFEYDESEMDNYEKELKRLLGPLYDDIVSNVLDKLEKFENFLEENKNEENFQAMKARQNIWEFLKKYNSEDYSPLGKSDKGYDIFFSYFNDVIFIPKEKKTKTERNSIGEYETSEVDSGYYSEDFRDMVNDPKKLELWSIYRKMSEFINATYDMENFGKIKAPFVTDQFNERLLKGFEGGLHNKYGKMGKFVRESTQMIKGFYYEKGTNTQGQRGVTKNLPEDERRYIRDLRNAKMLLGMSFKEADSAARKEIYETYSNDLDKAFETSLIAAAAHQARLETDPIAELIKDYMNEYQKDRKKSRERVEKWIDKVVKNKSFSSRGQAGKGGFSIVDWWDANESRKTARDRFNSVIQTVQDTRNLGKQIKIVVPSKIMNLLTEQEKTIINTFEQFAKSDLEGSDFTVSDNIGGQNFFFETKTITDENGNKKTLFYLEKDDSNAETPRYTYNKKVFTEKLNEYLAMKMQDMGLSLNIAGIADGILTSNLIVGMGLNPTSGLYQRLEGKTTNMILDVEGSYWTPGNLSYASEFLAYTNASKVAKRLYKKKNIGKRAMQMDIFRQVLERMSVLQQRVDELQKDSEGADKLLDVFAMAITLPEFKNQGEIALSVMADFTIEDNNGNSYKFFDKENQEFPMFTISNGVLKIKPEFSNNNFNSDKIQNLVIRIGSAIKQIQGNYDSKDVFGAKSKWYGRGFTQYFTWLPEFYNRRFGETEHGQELNVDLATGERKKKGRYIRGAEGSKLSAATFTATSFGVAYGLGTAGLALGIPLTSFYLYKMFRSMGSKKSIKKETNSIANLLDFMLSVSTEYINLPSRLASAVPGVRRLRVKNIAFQKESPVNKIFKTPKYNTITKEEKGALKAMSLELAVMLQVLSLKLMVGMLMWDDDDDELSEERLRYNFIQNQLSKYANTYNTLGVAPELIEGGLENGIVRTGTELYSFIESIGEGDFKSSSKSMTKALPIPSDIRNFLFDDLLPYQNKKNLDESFLNELGTMRWTSTWIKDKKTEGEYSAKKEWTRDRMEDRESIKKEFRDISGNKTVLKEIADNILDEMYLNKAKENPSKTEKISHSDLLKKQKEVGYNTKANRDKLIEKLEKRLRKKTNLTDDQIQEIIERRTNKY